MKPWLYAACVALGIAIACSPQRPDILLVSIDSLRADHLGAYDYPKPTSPTFDRLASEGVLFRNAVSTTSWTLPAHAALFTGLYDTSHGVIADWVALSADHLTMAEVLQRAGWKTAGFYGGPYLRPGFGLAQGFETYESCESLLPQEGPHQNVHTASHAGVTGPKTVEAVARWLDQAGDDPFFLFVHLWDVHYDYVPPPRYEALFDPDYKGSLSGEQFEMNRAIHRDMPARDLEHLIALYDGEIRFTDDILAALLALLEGHNRLANALVVVTADHGEEFFDHGDRGHEKTLFEEVVRVPLVFHWPGRIGEGLVVDRQVRLIDVMPTVLSLVGVPLSTDVQGRDLLPALHGKPLPPGDALMELHMLDQRLRALRTDEWVVITSRDKAPVYYDLRRDPAQRSPIDQSDPRLRAALLALRRAVVQASALREQRRAHDTASEIDPETRRRLEALGYSDRSAP